MKKTSPLLTALLFTTVAISQLSCDGASTVIDDDGSGNQTIIIKRNGSKDPFDAAEAFSKAQISDYSRLTVLHYKSESTPLSWDTPRGIYVLGGVYETAVATLYSVADEESFVALDFGTVHLDDMQIPLMDTAKVKYFVDGKLIPFTYQYVAQSDPGPVLEDPEIFTGKTLFTTSGGVGVQDVSQELALPERNLITNVSKDEVVDPEQEWVIQLQQPIVAPEISGIFIYNKILKVLENFAESGNVAGPQNYDDVPNISIAVTEPTATIVIPSEELLRLKNESQENVFVIQLGDLSKAGEVQLLDDSGDALATLDIAVYSWHSIQFKFKE
ncbi:MAG TPA: hypothetical protein VGA99_07195 [bacterium]